MRALQNTFNRRPWRIGLRLRGSTTRSGFQMGSDITNDGHVSEGRR